MHQATWKFKKGNLISLYLKATQSKSAEHSNQREENEEKLFSVKASKESKTGLKAKCIIYLVTPGSGP